MPVSLLDAWIAGTGIPELLSRASHTALADASHLLENLQKLDSEDAIRKAFTSGSMPESDTRAYDLTLLLLDTIIRRLQGEPVHPRAEPCWVGSFS